MVSLNDNTVRQIARHDSRGRHDRQRQTQHSELTCKYLRQWRTLLCRPIFYELGLLVSSLLDILPIHRFNMSIV